MAMTPENLAYYMRGFAENSSEPPTREQWGTMRHAIMSATTEPAYLHFGGKTPPELEALLAQGCKDCTPTGTGSGYPVLDTSKLPSVEGG